MKKIFLLIVSGLIAISCSGSDDGGGGDTTPDGGGTIDKVPIAANLVFPLENSECNEGKDFTATESTVNFMWESSANASRYRVEIVDLSTNKIEVQPITRGTDQDITIKLGTSYKWKVIAIGKDEKRTEVESAEWSFYNAGAPVEAYAPFPAQPVNPTKNSALDAATTQITVEWQASDLDDDIATYDLYFGTNKNPELVDSDLTSTKKENITVASGVTYYWKVVTKDAKNNTSTSSIFSFSIK